MKTLSRAERVRIIVLQQIARTRQQWVMTSNWIPEFPPTRESVDRAKKSR